MKQKLLILLSLAMLCLVQAQRMRPPKVSDELDFVEDDEEDEEWKKWGEWNHDREEEPMEGMTLGDGPIDVEKLMAKQRSGPQLAFARLKPADRTQADTDQLGVRWASLLRTGGLSDNVYAVDEDTILLQLTDGKNMDEVMEFTFLQEETDYFEWNQQKFFRPGEEREIEKPAPPKKKKSKKGKKKKKSAKGEL
eukprot:CAMPEP_0197845772 /NCGR_PEP_ID=MMETSP1438-20131217/2657_1 /TAXON_ID=1461541 /ORGANISM="Pterosperma sp., Strain CCMP1384" /LENGTH=193 /DNA_ID=CAMNT_0043457197 /DNA_START=70 /DNA_END=651 /DNA_ORIENTATION=+